MVKFRRKDKLLELGPVTHQPVQARAHCFGHAPDLFRVFKCLGAVMTLEGDDHGKTSVDLAELRVSEAVLREVPPLERFQSFLRLVVAAGPLAQTLTSESLAETFGLPLGLSRNGHRWVAQAI